MSDNLPSKNIRGRRNALALLGSFGLTSGMTMAASGDKATYLTTQAIKDAQILPTVKRIRTDGYAEQDDGGGAAWLRVPQKPKHPGYINDASGAIFEIDEDVLTPEMFGARGGDRDEYVAIQQSVSTAAMTKRRLEFRASRYSVGGEIIVPADAEKFALVGMSMTDLVQLNDNRCIFLFFGENTHHWTISGFRFLWRRDQTRANRNAYAVRFESDRPGGAGHWNFEISNCILVNGFRGFGQSDDGRNKRGCPVWGGAFRHIHSGINHAGAAIFLRTFGKSGQPNNSIEHFYARGDSCSEPAIIIESSDTTVLTSIEFNRGSGCQLLVESSSNVLIHGIRFEHVALKRTDAYIVASGGNTNIQLLGLSVQSIELATGSAGGSAVVRALNGARLKVDGFTDMPWRAPTILRDDRTRNAVAIVDAQGGDVTAGFIAPIFDPAITLARVAPGSTVRFADADSYDFVFEGKGRAVFARKIVRQRASVVAIAFFSEGVGEDVLKGLVVSSNGKPILGREETGLIVGNAGVVMFQDALRSQNRRLILEPGSLLSLSLPDFSSSPQGVSVLVSLIAVGI